MTHVRHPFRLGAKTRTAPIDRFQAKFIVDPNTGCWLWTASTKSFGYAQFNDGVTEGMVYAHRWSFQHFVGPVPAGKELDHLCRVRHCVNPQHLEPVTRRVNLARGVGPRRGPQKSHCPQGHPYDQNNTRVRNTPRGTKRICKTCERSQEQARHLLKSKGKVL